jgi:hypothetical protein
MTEQISPELQLLMELVDSPHWGQLREEARVFCASLRARALVPAKTEMDFYAKEGAAYAAEQLDAFLRNIEKTVRDAESVL